MRIFVIRIIIVKTVTMNITLTMIIQKRDVCTIVKINLIVLISEVDFHAIVYVCVCVHAYASLYSKQER